MKLSIFADLHPKGDRLAEWSRQWTKALSIATDRAEGILIAGDVFDKSNIGDANETTGAIIEAVRKPLVLASRSCPILAIPGNHDKASDAATDALTAIEPEVTVERDMAWRKFGDVWIACLPWFYLRDAETIIPRFIEIKGATVAKTVLLGHLEVVGSLMNDFKVCEGSGGWKVSREFLESLPVDFIRLGHYHKRQIDLTSKGGYNGALWQGDFTQAGNPQGFEILDTDTGAVEWVEVEEARRHKIEIYTAAEWKEACDHPIPHNMTNERFWIKTRGFELPRDRKAELQRNGFCVSAIDLPRPERASRLVTVGNVESTSDADLLNLYATTRNPKPTPEEIAAYQETLQRVLTDNPNLKSKSTAAGCVTPVKTIIRGIGQHVGTVIDWERTGRIVAVYGENGAGKTTGIGSIFWTLYGQMPGYNSSAAEMVSTFGDGSGEVESVFDYRGERYRAVRSVSGAKSKSPKQEGTLERMGALIAGPKISDFNRAVESLFGNADVALATWMMTARRDGDLCDATEGERREMYGRLLNFSRMEAISTAAGDTAKTSEAQSRELAAQLAGEPDHAALIEAERETIGRLGMERMETQAHLEASQKALADAQKALADAQAGDGELRAMIEAHERAVAEMRRATERYDAVLARLEAAKSRAAGIEEAREAVARLKTARERLATLEGQQDAFTAWQTWDSCRDGLRREADGHREAIATLEAIPGADAETEARAKALSSIEADYRKAEASNREIQNNKRRRESERAGFTAKIDAAETEIARLERQAASKPETPAPPDVCARCPLIVEFADIPNRIAKERRTVENLAAMLAASMAADAAEPPETDLAEIARKGAEARAAEKSVRAASEAVAKLADRRKRLTEAEAALQAHLGTEPQRADDPGIEIGKARAAIRADEDAPARLKLAEDARAMVEAINLESSTAADEAASACARVGEAEEPAARARQLLAEREKTLAGLRENVTEASDLCAMDGAHVKRLDGDIIRAEERIKTLTDAAGKVAEKRERLAGLEADAGRLRWIHEAFGRKGIQPLIIDESVPELETIANGLLSDATYGRMALSIRTQEPKGDGTIREAFIISVADGIDERDVGQWSGGERLIVQIAFRVAQAIWLSRRHGAALETIIIDEVFNNLDPGNESIMAEVLGKMAGHFSKTVVITPNPRVRDLFQSQIWFVKGPAGPEIKYVGGPVE